MQRKDEEEERIKSAAKRAQDEAARSTSSTSSVDISFSDDVMEKIRQAEDERAKASKEQSSSNEDKAKANSEIVSVMPALQHIKWHGHCQQGKAL